MLETAIFLTLIDKSFFSSECCNDPFGHFSYTVSFPLIEHSYSILGHLWHASINNSIAHLEVVQFSIFWKALYLKTLIFVQNVDKWPHNGSDAHVRSVWQERKSLVVLWIDWRKESSTPLASSKWAFDSDCSVSTSHINKASIQVVVVVSLASHIN